MPRRSALAVAGVLAGVLGGCGADGAAPTAARPVATTPAPARPAQATPGKTLVAAGDIACGPKERPSAIACHQAQTAALLDQLRPDVVAPLGDLQYPSGRLADFRRFFAPTWGRWRSRMRPIPGNHEYLTGATGYFAYFGARAGPRGRGWYSYDLPGWHVVTLNANCTKVGCAIGSAQERWLRADLARHRARCTLAYWHQPRFSSGLHGDDTRVIPLWRDLQRAGAELVLSGHDHSYERFAPQTASGRRDDRNGIVQFVVGTGGENHYPIFRAKPNSLVRNKFTFGVLELTLQPGSYSWRFVPEAGSTFTDAGSASCH